MLGMSGDVATRKVAGDQYRCRQLTVSWLPLDQRRDHEVAPEAGERHRPGSVELPGLTRTHDDKLYRTRTRTRT